MLVFPQTFNYRLIIGTLVIAIAVLGSYSVSNFNSFKNQEEFLEQETKLVQHELTEMILLYDDVSIENEVVKSKLEQSKSKIKDILSAVKKTKTDLSLISKYRSQINALKTEREVVFGQIDSLVRDNNTLHHQVDSVSMRFESQKLEIATLTKKNKNLFKLIKKVGVLKANNIKVVALKTTPSSVFETELLSEADYLEVCTTLKGNEYTGKGNKNIYVQILDTNDKLVSEKGILKYDGIHLGYSGKTTIKNVSEKTTVCLKISLNNKEKLQAGTYYVDVFQNTTLLESTSITLK